jgi:hypothetical protein
MSLEDPRTLSLHWRFESGFKGNSGIPAFPSFLGYYEGGRRGNCQVGRQSVTIDDEVRSHDPGKSDRDDAPDSRENRSLPPDDHRRSYQRHPIQAPGYSRDEEGIPGILEPLSRALECPEAMKIKMVSRAENLPANLFEGLGLVAGEHSQRDGS